MKIPGKTIVANFAGGHMTVRFISPHIIDAGAVANIAGEIESLLRKYRVQLLILDFTGVQQLSSQMFGQLLHLRKYMSERSGEARVCSMTGGVLHAFKLCRLEKVIPLFKTEKEALA